MNGGGTDGLRERLAALSSDQRARLEEALASGSGGNRSGSSTAGEAGHPFPLTEVQQAYWAGRQRNFGLGGVGTHSYTEFDTTRVDLDRLSEAWNRLIARHDMLRAIIDVDGMQRVLQRVPRYAIAIEDVSALSEEEREVRLRARRDGMSHQLLAADRWPVFEIRATVMGEARVRLHFSFDALIADMSSRRILMRELGLLYRDPGADLPAPTLTFRDFVLSEASARASPAYGRAREYWSGRDLPTAPALPVRDGYDMLMPPVFTRRTLRMAREPLERVARGLGITLNVLLITAYADVLRLWSGGERFTLNLTLFNRPQAAANVVGDFTSLTLLEIGRMEGLPFAARARAIQEQLWRDIDHRAFGGVSVLRDMTRARSGHSHALMPIVFTSALSGDEAGDDVSWLGEEVFGSSQTPQVWIDLVARDADGELVLQWNAVEDMLPPGMSVDMVSALARLLAHLSTDREAGALSWPATATLLLPDAMRATRGAANATEFAQPDSLLHSMWRQHAREAADRIAIIASETTLRYGELANISFDLAQRLRSLSAIPNSLVAIVMRKGWEQVAAVLSVLESGAAYLPMDHDLPAARLRLLLSDANVKIVLTQPDLVGRLAVPDGVVVIAVDATARQSAVAAPQPCQKASDLAYVIYTSGSSGRPKGVAIEHRSAVNTIDDINTRYAVGPSDRVLALSSLAFDLSVYDIFGVLGAGGTIVVPEHDRLRDPAHWAELMSQHDVTLWNSVPALMELLIDYLRGGKPGRLASLRLALLSGDRIPLKLPDAMRRAGCAGRIACLGGATEASVWSILHETGTAASGRNTIPYGRPLRNQTMYVFGPGAVDCPDWVPGDIHIGGRGVARGYWNDPERTAEAFVFDVVRGLRLYRTGDRGCYLPDGSIEFLGREDGQVKLRGYRVELGEIEAVLMEHEAVGEAVVVAKGEDSSSRTLAAFIVLVEGAVPPIDAIHAHLKARLPAHMVPPSLTVISQPPLTANGKIDRRALALSPTAIRHLVTSETAHENLGHIARIVRDASRVPIPSLDSDLLELGLNSVDVIRIGNALDAALGYRPDINTIYASPTIRAIAQGCPIREPAKGPPAHAIRAHAAERKAIPLTPKALPDAVGALFASRRSTRRFSLRPVSAVSLGGLFEALRVRADGTRNYASASALYPVRLYMAARPGHVEGVEAGSYVYDPVRHALQRVSADRPDRSFFAPSNIAVFEEAAFVFFLVAQLETLEERYGPRGWHLATIEAGLVSQLLETAAPGCGLGLCQIGSAKEAAIESLLELKPRERFVHAIFGGVPDEAACWENEHTEETRLKRYLERVGHLTAEETASLRDAYRQRR
ncbi:MAG: amino acid adenylation domain-containing protein [Rhizomicrobium sp.]